MVSRSCVVDEHDGSRCRAARAGAPRSAVVAASSSPVNGSSSRTSRGSCSSARSSASRCRMPREKPDTGRPGAPTARPGRAPRSMRALEPARARTCCRRTAGSRPPTAPDRGRGRGRAGRCGRADRRRLRSARCSPYGPRRTTASSSVAVMERSVDLPAPLGPSSAMISPASQRNDTRVEGTAAPEMTRDVDERQRREVRVMPALLTSRSMTLGASAASAT